ncbi:hypothetical protein ACFO4E_24505 [Nocardiopsis mangrovi]|uniref:Uncharacterized protein n=1 Tax=Nocardiopsis mangrovi TaxID=1179818 RepID=A0ABV9E1I8_9ACTN
MGNQNAPRDAGWLRRTLDDILRRLRALETAPRTRHAGVSNGGLHVRGGRVIVGDTGSSQITIDPDPGGLYPRIEYALPGQSDTAVISAGEYLGDMGVRIQVGASYFWVGPNALALLAYDTAGRLRGSVELGSVGVQMRAYRTDGRQHRVGGDGVGRWERRHHGDDVMGSDDQLSDRVQLAILGLQGSVNEGFANVRTDFAATRGQLDVILQRLDQQDRRVDGQAEQLAALDSRVDALERFAVTRDDLARRQAGSARTIGIVVSILALVVSAAVSIGVALLA